MIGVIVPVHNEEGCLAACLQAVSRAAVCPGLRGEAVLAIVVLDTCYDRSADIAAEHGVLTLCIAARNVGMARAAGAAHALALGMRWLAFTDADTIVSPDLAQHPGATRRRRRLRLRACGRLARTIWNWCGSATRNAIAHRMAISTSTAPTWGLLRMPMCAAAGFPRCQAARTWRWCVRCKRAVPALRGAPRRAW